MAILATTEVAATPTITAAVAILATTAVATTPATTVVAATLVITAAVAILATTVVVTTLVITVAVETPVAPAVLVKAKARDSQTCLSPQGELSGWRNRPPRMSAWLGIGGPRWSLSGRIAYRI